MRPKWQIGFAEFRVPKRAVRDSRRRSQHSIALPSLPRLCGAPIPYLKLAEEIDKVAAAASEASD